MEPPAQHVTNQPSFPPHKPFSKLKPTSPEIANFATMPPEIQPIIKQYTTASALEQEIFRLAVTCKRFHELY